MINSINAEADRFLNDMRGLNERLDRAQQEVAGGKKLRDPSDSPDEVSQLLGVRANLSRLAQTQSNLSRVKSEVDTAEQSIQAAGKLMDRVRTLGMAGVSGTQTAETRETLADELGSILERMVGLANTQSDGRYLFSGDSDQGASYSYDAVQTPAWSSYQGTASTRQTMHPSGVAFAVGKTAQEIFDNADGNLNVYQAIDTLRGALVSNDDDAIQAAIAPLAGVSAHLNQMLSFYGNVQSQMTEAVDVAGKMKLQLQTQLADIEDADITSAIVELQQLKFQQTAAMQVRASMPKQSLFDFLG
jgi:flagellar hook-associated protein 3 FlgL